MNRSGYITAGGYTCGADRTHTHTGRVVTFLCVLLNLYPPVNGMSLHAVREELRGKRPDVSGVNTGGLSVLSPPPTWAGPD